MWNTLYCYNYIIKVRDGQVWNSHWNEQHEVSYLQKEYIIFVSADAEKGMWNYYFVSFNIFQL